MNQFQEAQSTTATTNSVAQEEATDGKNFSITISKKIASDKGIQLKSKVLVKTDVSSKVISKTLPYNYCSAASCYSCSKNGNCCT
jgi:hypothetical protein